MPAVPYRQEYARNQTIALNGSAMVFADDMYDGFAKVWPGYEHRAYPAGAVGELITAHPSSSQRIACSKAVRAEGKDP